MVSFEMGRPLRWGRFFFSFLLLTVSVVYFPGLSGDFLFDDYSNIVSRSDLHIEHFDWATLSTLALSGEAGPLKRPIAVLTFALNHLLFGLNPWWFKMVNLWIHLANGVLFFVVSKKLFQRIASTQIVSPCFLAWLATAIWLLHPLNVSTVLYVVQRMASLATFFMLLGILLYLSGRTTAGRQRWMLIFSGLLCTVPAALSKENGLLLPGFLFLIEWLVLRFEANPSEKSKLILFFAIFVFAPFLCAIGWFFIYFDSILGGYANRPFTIGERVMTEARVLWFYLRLFFIPDLSEMGLFNEDFDLSTGLFSPPSTFLSFFGLFVLLVLAFAFRERMPIVSLGILWFFYGHSLESSVIPLDLVYEHRNYFPYLGLSLVSSYALGKTPKRIQIFAVSAFIIVLSIATFSRSSLWGNTRAHMLVEVENHPESPATLYEAGRVMLRLAEQSRGSANTDFFERSISFFRAAAEKGNVGGYYALLMIRSALGDDYRSELNALTETLMTNPIDPVTFFLLPELVRCQHDNRCKISKGEIIALYDALLANPRLQGRGRAIVLNQMAYLLLAQGDKKRSVNLAKEAIEVLPDNGCSYLAMIDFYRMAGDEKNATILLQLADEKGVSQCFGVFRKLKKRLDDGKEN